MLACAFLAVTARASRPGTSSAELSASGNEQAASAEKGA
jgi:hypothetical protein